MTIEHTLPADQAADLVRHLYRAFLGRDPNEDEVVAHAQRLRGDDAIAAVSIIACSPEANAFRAATDEAARRVLPHGMLAIARADVARVVTKILATVRKEEPSPYEVASRVDGFDAGTALAAVLDDIFQETSPLRQIPEDDAAIDRTTQIMYRLALGRAPGPVDLANWRGAVTEGGRLSNVVLGIGESPEAHHLRGGLDIVPGAKVQLAFEIILGRGASAAEVDHFRTMIEGHALDVAPLIGQLFAGEVKRRLQPASPSNDPQQAYLFGSRGTVNIADWQFGTRPPAPAPRRHHVLGPGSVVRLRAPGDRPADASTGAPVVSIVASLYRGGAFIRSFLENITSQTIFRTHCELIIVDADSPEGEQAVIEEFRRDFPNIVYQRMDTRIGIYEAWNIGVALARGRYITNANLDDVRRADSLEIQAALLDTFEFVDVVYQDVLYAFTPRLPFEEIERRDFCTDLPIVSRYNLMEFNSPHNAPMWRAVLHRDVGLFDQTLQSAADFQFWLRCRAAGKTFYKSNESHAAYFVNPDGISTRPDTRGMAESNAISRDLYRKIVSPLLVIADQEFLARVDAIEDAPLREGRRYDIVQSALMALGTRRVEPAA